MLSEFSQILSVSSLTAITQLKILCQAKVIAIFIQGFVSFTS